jgi:hypothetical protein
VPGRRCVASHPQSSRPWPPADSSPRQEHGKDGEKEGQSQFFDLVKELVNAKAGANDAGAAQVNQRRGEDVESTRLEKQHVLWNNVVGAPPPTDNGITELAIIER